MEYKPLIMLLAIFGCVMAAAFIMESVGKEMATRPPEPEPQAEPQAEPQYVFAQQEELALAWAGVEPYATMYCLRRHL
jgi:hypothetical protein